MISALGNSTDRDIDDCLDDVETRFLYNLPESELSRSERLFFQIEQAWWFYEDFYADKYSSLPHFKSLKTFAELIFARCPLLSKIQHKFNDLFTDFGNYKNEIPVCGCILLNSDMSKLALACSWKGKSWCFPKGKIDEGESSYDCAIRETLEETGYDARSNCREEDEIAIVDDSKIIRMFIATNVSENYNFVPQTRKEVSKVEFFSLDALPKSTYAVIPFLPKLRRWISLKQKQSRKLLLSKSPARNLGFDSSKNKVTILQRSPARINGRNPSAPKDRGGKDSNKDKKNIPINKHFDGRNVETFAGEVAGGAAKGWTVTDMFQANAKLTGKKYEYDGNPHAFGSTHPRFIDYRNKNDNSYNAQLGQQKVTPKFHFFAEPFVLNTTSVMSAFDEALRHAEVNDPFATSTESKHFPLRVLRVATTSS